MPNLVSSKSDIELILKKAKEGYRCCEIHNLLPHLKYPNIYKHFSKYKKSLRVMDPERWEVDEIISISFKKNSLGKELLKSLCFWCPGKVPPKLAKYSFMIFLALN